MAEQNSPVPIIHIFETLHDPRKLSKILYPLLEILLTTLCAVISGADSYVEIEEFGESRLDFLKQFLPFENGIPSHDPFGLVFSAIDKISWIQDKEKWTKLQTIGCVQSTRQIGEKTSTESRYYISSLPLNVQEFAYAVRNHWSIENNLHWVMDIVFRDDDCRIRTKNAPGNFVIMKHMAQNMLKLLDSKKSMRVKRKLAGWDDSFLAKTLGVPF